MSDVYGTYDSEPDISEIIANIDKTASKNEVVENKNPFSPFSSREEAQSALENYQSFKSGFKPRPYQIEDILQAPNANFRILHNHEVGLGKTMIGNLTVWFFKKTPCIILCKKGLQHQWFHENLEWTNELSQIIKQPDDMLLPVPFYIVSLDLARKFSPDDWARFNAQSIIIDECQHVKNIEAKRTTALRKLSRNVPHIIALSANAIENRFTEYFPILNMLRPDDFRTPESFMSTWVNYYYDRYTGKMKGDRVKNPKLWRDATRSFIVRRLKSDVLKELPPVQMSNHYFNLEKRFGQEYETYLSQFTEYYDNTKDTGFALQTNILAYLQKMRHLTGRAKVETVVDFVKEFLESTEGELTEDGVKLNENPRKIILFCHFKDVAAGIVELLNSYLRENGYQECLVYASKLSAEERAILTNRFKHERGARVMVASLLAAGEGLNLQFSSDSILVDRHWNYSKEHQAVVGRLHRLGQTAERVNANFILALGTIDEWLTRIVARKELIVKEANDGTLENFDEIQVIMELAEEISRQRDNKPWRSAF